MGIETAWHLACCDDQQVMQDFGVVLRRTMLELRGVPCSELEPEAPKKKQIVSSRAFSSRQKGWQPIKQSIALYTARAAEKLRAQGSVCRRVDVGLIVRTATADSFRDTWSTASAKLMAHTDDTIMLQGAAVSLAKRVFDAGSVYAKSSISLSEICQPSDISHDMFVPAAVQSEVSKIIDCINSKFGRGTMRTGICVSDSGWSMQRDYLSPHYTTRISDLPRLK